MGGTWGKSEELTNKSENIWYKKVKIYNVTINIFGNTDIINICCLEKPLW
jgi:hypothetical protein